MDRMSYHDAEQVVAGVVIGGVVASLLPSRWLRLTFIAAAFAVFHKIAVAEREEREEPVND